MNFFSEQDRARKKTFQLILLMSAAVISLIFITSIAIVFFLELLPKTTNSYEIATTDSSSFWKTFENALNSGLLIYAALAIILTVIGGSFYKWFELNGNGTQVALALGGRPILTTTLDPQEKKILNVVEEMAIASGNPVPQVFLLEDSSINAFAAGMDRRTAVIGVTRGCINLLTREELQGVIAHEFSHIHNGDMRLNLRLVAVLHGILLISLIGYYLIRTPRTSRNSRDNNSALFQLGLGATLIGLGYTGVFFGNLIKAAVSRQREFLADASAVQFTRNPDGIANALKKIGGHTEHSFLSSPRAAEFSHMYFGQGIQNSFNAWMATHPPLKQRIRKIQPRWDGRMIVPEKQVHAQTKKTEEKKSPLSHKDGPLSAAISMAIHNVGNPSPSDISNAQHFLKTLPEILLDSAHEPLYARTLVCGLLLDQENIQTNQKQWEILQKYLDSASLKHLKNIMPALQRVPRSHYLSVIDLVIPAIKVLSTIQMRDFIHLLHALIHADNNVSLFEWCLNRILICNSTGKSISGNKRLIHMNDEVHSLLIASCQELSDLQFSKALSAAEKHLSGLVLQKEINRRFDIQEFDRVITQLEQLHPMDKPRLLKGLAAAMESDGLVTPMKAELFRAIADCLDCPVSPLSIGLTELQKNESLAQNFL